MRSNRGFSLPLMWLLLLLIALLAWWLGWIALAGVVVLFGAITAGVAIHDVIVHDKHCRWCNVIKERLVEERGIALERIETKHAQSFPTHLHVQVYVDGTPDIQVDIDFNGVILGVEFPPA